MTDSNVVHKGTFVRAIEEHAAQACLNWFPKHTVGIANTIRTVGTHPVTNKRADTEEPGTGVAARWGGHYFIVTAAHVVANARIQDLRVYSFAHEAMKFKSASQLTIEDIAEGTYLSVKDSSLRRCQWEDLAVITLPQNAFGGMEFVDLASDWVDPAQGENVHCCGFPSDHSVTVGKRKTGEREEIDLALYPTVFSGKVLPLPSDEDRKYRITEFNPELHFLIPYEVTPMSSHPRGISGAAVWSESDENQIVWRANFKLAGICTSCYRNGAVVQATKACVVRRFLAEIFGPANDS